MQTKLSKSFGWLNATQFLGALNDNVFKLLVTFYVIHLAGKEHAGALTNLGGLFFAVPFILLLPACGVLADRSSKRDVIVWAKVLEVVVMAAAVGVFLTGKIWLAFALLFLMSAQSALFGPAKYGIIPELAPKALLSRANGLIVGATYLAIIVGTTGGSQLRQWFGDRFALAASVCVLVAVAGTLTSIPIERVRPAGTHRKPSLFFFMDAWATLRSVRQDRHLLLAILGGAYFSLIGAFLQANVIPYGMQVLGLNDADSGLLFLYAALGIGAGSVIIGKLSGRNIEFGILPLAAFGLGLSTLLLAFGSPSLWMVKALLFTTGLSAGLYIVPLDAFIQWRSPKDRVGEVIAASNWLGWIGVLLASLTGLFMYTVLKLSPPQGFAVIGVLTLALTLVTIKLLPDFLVRFIAMVLTRSIYRIKTVGLENLPAEGGALLVSNHVSFMDALQILATQQRRIRFLMHRPIYEGSWMQPVFKLMGVIPIAMEDPPKKIVESLRAARKAMDEGYMVCIFAEGALTRNGLMRGFKPGLERIVKGSDYPIIPVYIGGAWGSIFSHYYGKQHLMLPNRFPYPLSIHFGQPMKPESKAWEVRAAVSELACDYFEQRKPGRVPLMQVLAETARHNWHRLAVTDTTGKRLSFGQLLTATVLVRRRLLPRVGEEPRVGVLLPTSAGGALVNLALTQAGRVPVNLNFTASDEAFQSALRQAGIRTVISSGAFLEKFPQFRALSGLLLLEDVMKEPRAIEKLTAFLTARLCPLSCLGQVRGFDPDHEATIIFSSGTTGEPKGVILTHHNIMSNVESLSMVFRPREDDNICAALPLFHSFGYTAGLWFPLLTGMGAHYHTSPLDGGRIAQMVREQKCTALFATPTFLLAYLRKAAREDFQTLRHVVVGAEKMKPRLADAFQERFGLRPLEGYGATELSPVAALSLPDVEIGGIFQQGTKEGSVGQAVPGVAVRIIDPDHGILLPPGQPGLMLIRGPNVMKGYLGQPEKTAEVLKDGWYVTGDIATVDDDGFITITDRLSRFSKIGGEMVPHIAIEDEYLKGLKRSEAVLAVASVPDDKKGEKLVVLYTEAAGPAEDLQRIIQASEIPNLWKPAKDAYYRIEALPLTGSGKLDVKTLRRMAESYIGSAAAGVAAEPKPEQ